RSGRLWRLLAGPRPGRPAEGLARSVVDDAAHGTEDRPLDEERGRELAPAHRTVVGPGWLMVIHPTPDQVEELLGDHAGEKRASDADRDENRLLDHARLPVWLVPAHE